MPTTRRKVLALAAGTAAAAALPAFAQTYPDRPVRFVVWMKGRHGGLPPPPSPATHGEAPCAT